MTEEFDKNRAKCENTYSRLKVKPVEVNCSRAETTNSFEDWLNGERDAEVGLDCTKILRDNIDTMVKTVESQCKKAIVGFLLSKKQNFLNSQEEKENEIDSLVDDVKIELFNELIVQAKEL